MNKSYYMRCTRDSFRAVNDLDITWYLRSNFGLLQQEVQSAHCLLQVKLMSILHSRWMLFASLRVMCSAAEIWFRGGWTLSTLALLVVSTSLLYSLWLGQEHRKTVLLVNPSARMESWCWGLCEGQFYVLIFCPGPACSPDGSTASWVCLLTSVKSEVFPSFSCVCLLVSMKNLSERNKYLKV